MFDLPAVALPPMTTAEFMDWPGDGTGRMFQLIDGVVRPVTPTVMTQGMILSTLSWLITGAMRAARLPAHALIRGAIVSGVNPDTNVRLPPLVTTAAPDERGQLFVRDPLMMIEILSRANHDDICNNIQAYFTLPSVQEVVVVDSTCMLVKVHHRAHDGTWMPDPEVVRPGGRLRLVTVALDCAVEDIYHQTWLAAQTS